MWLSSYDQVFSTCHVLQKNFDKILRLMAIFSAFEHFSDANVIFERCNVMGVKRILDIFF